MTWSTQVSKRRILQEKRESSSLIFRISSSSTVTTTPVLRIEPFPDTCYRHVGNKASLRGLASTGANSVL